MNERCNCNSHGIYLFQLFSTNLKINIYFVHIFRAVFGLQHPLLLLHEVNPELKVEVLLLELVELVVVLPHGEVAAEVPVPPHRGVGHAPVHLPRQGVLVRHRDRVRGDKPYLQYSIVVNFCGTHDKS